MAYGKPDCDLCRGTGHIVEIQRVIGSRIEMEIRPFDPDTEQRPDEGEVWVCPNCFWEVDPLAVKPRSTSGIRPHADATPDELARMKQFELEQLHKGLG